MVYLLFNYEAKPPLPRKRFDRENKKGTMNFQPKISKFDSKSIDNNLTASVQIQQINRKSILCQQSTSQSVIKETMRGNTSTMSDFKSIKMLKSRINVSLKSKVLSKVPTMVKIKPLDELLEKKKTLIRQLLTKNSYLNKTSPSYISFNQRIES